jgi:hypothetical protein
VVAGKAAKSSVAQSRARPELRTLNV